MNPHLLLVVSTTFGFLGLHGLLWIARPTAGLWLTGSIVLGLLWGAAFMRLIARGQASE